MRLGIHTLSVLASLGDKQALRCFNLPISVAVVAKSAQIHPSGVRRLSK